MIYNQAVQSRFVIDYQPQPDVEVEGGFNFAVEPGVYDDTIWLDFARLYPSLIVANNICYTTMIVGETDIPDEKLNIIPGTNKKQVFVTKYVKPEVRRGILPIILMEKISQRDQTKIDITNADTEGIRNRLKRREKALKNTTNAFYGFLAINDEKGTLSLLMAAVTITYLGRDLTESINTKLELEYDSKVLYNDTDSVVFQNASIQKQDLYKRANEIVAELNKDLPNPIRLAFDRIGRFVLLKQKKYAVLEYDEKGEPTTEIIKKGLVVGRSDACQFVEDVYSKMLDHILLKDSMIVTFNDILDNIIDLDEGRVTNMDLSMTKKINTKYAPTSTYFLKRFLDRLAEKGVKIALGTEVEYVVVFKETETKVGEKMELLSMLTPEDIPDVEYYIENVIQNPIDQLWQIGYKDVLVALTGINYKPVKSRKKPVNISEPVKIINLAYTSGVSFDDIRKWVEVNILK